MSTIVRELRTSYAFVERNYNLVRRYWGWEVVFLVYSIVNGLTILYIGAASEMMGGPAVNTRYLILYLLIGTLMWSYLSALFEVVAETITWERWEGTIEYTLMAPVNRLTHLLGTCLFAVIYSLVRTLVIFAIVSLFFQLDLASANLAGTALVVLVGSVSLMGLAILASVLPLLFTERGAQMTFIIQASLLLVSGVYYPIEVLPGWLQAIAPLSPVTYILQGVRGALLDGAGWERLVGLVAPLGLMGIVSVPLGLWVFVQGERYAKRTGRLKRNG